MNLTKMIIMMFLHCVSDLAWLYQLSTKDLLEKVLSDPHQKTISQRHCQNLETIYAKFDLAISPVAFPFLLCLSLSRCATRGKTRPYAHIPVPIVGPTIGLWQRSICLESRLNSLKSWFWSQHCKRYACMRSWQGFPLSSPLNSIRSLLLSGLTQFLLRQLPEVLLTVGVPHSANRSQEQWPPQVKAARLP